MTILSERGYRVVQHYRNTWAEINLDAVDANIKQIKQSLSKKTEIMAVVKADAYGHGAIEIAKQALKSGATALAVALLEEAISLRNAGIDAPILVLSWVPPESASIAAEHHITLTVYQREWLESVNDLDFSKQLSIHIKWDTGMGRVGLRTKSELSEIIQVLNEKKHIYLTGVYTHYATADEADLTFYHEQSKRFSEFVTFLKTLWPYPLVIHSSNSAASFQSPEREEHYIRLGIAMYGLYPSEVIKSKESIQLKPVLSLHSRLIHVKQIQRGDTISYGREYEAEKAEWIGTIPIGYGDGWARRLQGSPVLIEGKRFPIVGRICMDQTMILLDKPYPIGTKVTLIGQQNDNFISMDEIAEYLGTINYEIACMINDRVPRVYLEKNTQILP